MESKQHFLLSRTDSIGDVILSLPMASWLREQFPEARITFLCRDYTAPIVKNYVSIDEVISLDDLQKISEKEAILSLEKKHFTTVIHVFPNKKVATWCKKAKIKHRIGTSHRIFHWFSCNIKPNFTRKNSTFHEAQLNFELLKPLGVIDLPTFDQLNEWTNLFRLQKTNLPELYSSLNFEKSIILHPKSQGSAREWPIEKYVELANHLLQENWTIFFTGTEKEGIQFKDHIPKHSNCFDTTGKLSLDELQALIFHVKALVACSTGPLHIAGFLNKTAIGLYVPRVPIHPGRWKPLGKFSTALVFNESCDKCSKGEDCLCIKDISVDQVLKKLNN